MPTEDQLALPWFIYPYGIEAHSAAGVHHMLL